MQVGDLHVYILSITIIMLDAWICQGDSTYRFRCCKPSTQHVCGIIAHEYLTEDKFDSILKGRANYNLTNKKMRLNCGTDTITVISTSGQNPVSS